MGLFDTIHGMLGSGGDGGSSGGSADLDDGGTSKTGGSSDEYGTDGGSRTGGTAADGPGSGDGPRMVDVSDPDEREVALDHFRSQATDLSTYWWEYGLDYSPASLARLDTLVDDEWGDKEWFQDVEADPEGTHEERVFSGLSRQIGGYFGEVLVRHLDGEWHRTPDFGWAVVVDGPETEVTSNVFHVARDCLREPAKLATTYDTIARETGQEGIGNVEQAPTFPYPMPPESASPEDFRAATEKLASFSPEALDRSPDSLSTVDDLLREKLFDGEVNLDRLSEREQRSVISQLGSYFGEVFVETYGGEWRYDADRGGWGVVFGTSPDPDGIDAFVMVVTALKTGESLRSLYEHVDEATAQRSGRQRPGERLPDDLTADDLPGDLTPDDVGPGGVVVEQDDEDEATAEDMQESATDLVSDHPEYDLDYSVDSLSNLDALAEAEIVDTVAEMRADAEMADQGAGMLIGGLIFPYAAYFGEVLRRSNDGAAWIQAEDGPAVAVPTGGDAVSIDVLGVAAAAASRDQSFAALYRDIVREL